MPISIEEQIKEVKREIAMRQRVYPRWVEGGRLRQETADHQIETLRAVLDSLAELAQKGKLL